MKIKFKLSKKDWLVYNFYFFASRKYLQIILLVMLVVGYIFDPYKADHSLDISVTLAIIIADVISYILSGILLASIIYSATIVLRSLLVRYRKDKNVFKERAYTFNANKIQLETEGFRSVTDWDFITSVEITKTHIFIFITSNQAYVIPRRVLGGEKEFKQFRKMIPSKVKIINHEKVDVVGHLKWFVLDIVGGVIAGFVSSYF